MECVKALIKAKANVDKAATAGETVLMLAVKKWKTSCRKNGPVIYVRV